MADLGNIAFRTTHPFEGPPAGKANDDLIERYVRFTASLDEAARGLVDHSIQRHLDAAAVERFYRGFYETYDAAEPVISPRVEAFIASLFDERAM